MYKIINIVIAVAVMIITASCVKTEDPASGGGISDGGGTVEGNRVEMTFQLTTSDMSRPTVSIPLQSADNSSSMTVTMNDPVTRAETDSEAAGTDDENKITGLWVLQFSGTVGASTLVSREYYPSTAFVGNKVAVSFIEADGDICAYFVANVGEDYFKTTPIESLSAFEAMVCNFTPSATNVPANGLPMIGTYKGIPSAMSGKISLTRMVAKIDFTCIVDPASAAESFVVKEVQLVSAAAGSAIVAPELPSGATGLYPDSSKKENFTDSSLEKIDAAEDMEDQGDGKMGFTRTWYVAENLRGVIAGLEASDKGEKNAPLGSTYIEVTGDYTNAEGTIEVSYCIYPGRNATDNFNIERNYLYTITSTIKGMDESDTRVVIGENLSVDGTANCYMVHEAGKRYRFDATTMGNGKKTGEFILSGYRADSIVPRTLNPDEVIVLWETGEKGSVIDPESIVLRGDEVFFTTYGEKGDDVAEGNAAIGVLKGGEVIWSWHIWSTKYDPEEDFVTLANHKKYGSKTYYSMQYNLGATIRASYKASEGYNFVPESYGLLYQWGRKDPFIGPSAATGTGKVMTTPYDNNYDWKWNVTADDSSVKADPIKYTIQHPTYFIKGVYNNYDWVTTNIDVRRDNLWGNPNAITGVNSMVGAKSIYDPCPPGWRVPPQDTWTGFTTTGASEGTSSANVYGSFKNGLAFYTSGSTTGVTTFFPATGFITSSSGTLTSVGSIGYYWSSSPSSEDSNNHAGGLSFGSDYVNPQYSYYRANGFSVRCVKEMEENE